MKRIIYKNAAFCAVSEDGVLVEYLPTESADRTGDVLVGRVERMMPGLSCAFVDIGRRKSGFLPLEEKSRSFTGGPLHSGEYVPVQIRREETGDKGAFLSRDITLAGKWCLVMPMNQFVGVSSRIQDEESRETLKQRGQAIAAGRFGIVMRSAALRVEPEEIREEAEKLFQDWTMPPEGNADRDTRPGGVIFRQSDPIEQLCQDYSARGETAIAETEQLSQDLDSQLREAQGRKVRMKGGGTLVFDRCEALTVIDVNTASNQGIGKGKESTVLDTNLEACERIGQQLRLRNTGGIVLIDFIDMERETDRSLVMETLQMTLEKDRVKTVIHGWTTLGLMEMTRKRTRPELWESMQNLSAKERD